MKPRFLLDEHIDHSIQRQLRRIDPHVDVIAIGDSSSPPVGISDSDILLWMEKSGYILITENLYWSDTLCILSWLRYTLATRAQAERRR